MKDKFAPNIGIMLGFYSIAMDPISEHTHDYFEMFFLLKNSATHYLNGSKQILPEGSLVLIRPGNSHYLKNADETDCRFVNVSIRTDVMDKILEFLQIEEITQHSKFIDDALIVQLRPYEKFELERKFNSLNFRNEERYLSKLKMIATDALYYFFPEQKDSSVEELPNWLKQALQEFSENQLFRDGLQKLYSCTGKSPEYLCRIFRKHLGKSPSEYINELRIEYASKLLLVSNYDIMEISMECGIENLSYFYRLFKKKFGISPSKYRIREI